MTNKIVQMKESISITVDVLIMQEDEYYVVFCPSLSLSGYGDSVENAKKSFDTEMKIFLEETKARGTFEKYLLKNGWRLQQIPFFNYEPPQVDINKFTDITKSQLQTFQQSIPVPVN